MHHEYVDLDMTFTAKTPRLKLGVRALLLAGVVTALWPEPGRAQGQRESSQPPQQGDQLGTLLIAGYDSDNVVEFDLSTRRWSELARLPKGSKPRGIAVGSGGEIFFWGFMAGKMNVAQLLPGDGGMQLKDISGQIGQYGPGIIVFHNGQIWSAGDSDRVIYEINPTNGTMTTAPDFLSTTFNIVGTGN